jgi:tetratricopeptide (TPR) repeat protein
MLTRRHVRIIAGIAMVALSLVLSLPLNGVAQAASEGSREAVVDAHVVKLSDEVGDLSSKLESAEKSFTVVLIPFSILITILVAGGTLGIVFSVRDQRRTSQLHELAVSGELAAQKRSEQSYGSFLEQSQTTLSLVNDTLGLAKEANDRAMQSMKNKAQSQIDEIEERSQRLLLDVFTQEEFELIINDAHRRNELHDIAADLRSLEGYLSLQDITLPQYTKFIKALDQFLLDDTEAAIHALRLGAQEASVGDLEHFAEYWLGYMLTTVGEYDEAIRKFRHDELQLKEDEPEYFQLERIIAETEFFLIAKENVEEETASKKGRVVTGPQARFQLVAPVLDKLSELAKKLEESTNQHAKSHTRLEIARTRADIYEWVAYDPDHLDDPLRPEQIDAADAVRGKYGNESTALNAVEFGSSEAWTALQDPDVFRAWALRQAEDICKGQTERNLDLDFALAECLFKLNEHDEADASFASAAHALEHEFRELHEKRRSASIHQSVLICHSRLLFLRQTDPNQRREQKRDVRDALGDTFDVLKDMRQGQVTVFSQIQRRNVTQTEFKEEVRELVEQDPLMKETHT